MFSICIQELNLLASIALGTSNKVEHPVRHLPWDCGCVRDKEVWLWCNEKGHGRLGVLHVDDRIMTHLNILSCEVIIPFSVPINHLS